jgi:hypothetical protein
MMRYQNRTTSFAIDRVWISLIWAENREFATRDRFRRTASTTTKSAQIDVISLSRE